MTFAKILLRKRFPAVYCVSVSIGELQFSNRLFKLSLFYFLQASNSTYKTNSTLKRTENQHKSKHIYLKCLL